VQVAESWQRADRQRIARAAARGELPGNLREPEPGDPAVVVPDELLDIVIQADAADRAAATAALAAHATQVQLSPPWWGLSDGCAAVLRDREGFRRVSGPPIPAAQRPAADLFAGIAES
jgi:N-acetyl-1-D-myo-inositol-2-amino-2-deoxy-alpha-D-glucopyranoside deacetylase